MNNRVLVALAILVGYIALNTAVFLYFNAPNKFALAVRHTAVTAFLSGAVSYAVLAGMGILQFRGLKLLSGFVGTAVLLGFIIGLAHSISTGFAGFWGGFPFWVIAVAVLLMAAYDFWDECVRKKNNP